MFFQGSKLIRPVQSDRNRSTVRTEQIMRAGQSEERINVKGLTAVRIFELIGQRGGGYITKSVGESSTRIILGLVLGRRVGRRNSLLRAGEL
jgi:hypothetical protein